jgi:hypothetical protein
MLRFEIQVRAIERSPLLIIWIAAQTNSNRRSVIPGKREPLDANEVPAAAQAECHAKWNGPRFRGDDTAPIVIQCVQSTQRTPDSCVIWHCSFCLLLTYASTHKHTAPPSFLYLITNFCLLPSAFCLNFAVPNSPVICQIRFHTHGYTVVKTELMEDLKD